MLPTIRPECEERVSTGALWRLVQRLSPQTSQISYVACPGSAVHFGFHRVQRRVCRAEEDIEFVAVGRKEGNAYADG